MSVLGNRAIIKISLFTVTVKNRAITSTNIWVKLVRLGVPIFCLNSLRLCQSGTNIHVIPIPVPGMFAQVRPAHEISIFEQP